MLGQCRFGVVVVKIVVVIVVVVMLLYVCCLLVGPVGIGGGCSPWWYWQWWLGGRCSVGPWPSRGLARYVPSPSPLPEPSGAELSLFLERVERARMLPSPSPSPVPSGSRLLRVPPRFLQYVRTLKGHHTDLYYWFLHCDATAWDKNFNFNWIFN